MAENLEVEMKLYAEATKVAHIFFCYEQEIEKSNQFARRNNVKISYLPNWERRDESVVTKFLIETLYALNPNLAQTFHIGNTWTQSCAIIVKLLDQTQRDTILTNISSFSRYGRFGWILNLHLYK